MKVILNKCYGGFEVSDEAYKLYARKKGIEIFKYRMEFCNEKPVFQKNFEDFEDFPFAHYFTKDFGNRAEISDEDFEKYSIYLDKNHREDPVLIEVIEELGKKANGQFSKLVVVDIPDGMEYEIDDYDGIETLHQKVQTW